MHSVRVSKLKTNKKRNRFHAEHASINIISCFELEASGGFVGVDKPYLEMGSLYLDTILLFWISRSNHRTGRVYLQLLLQVLAHVQHYSLASIVLSSSRILLRWPIQRGGSSCKGFLYIDRDRQTLAEILVWIRRIPRRKSLQGKPGILQMSTDYRLP